MKIYNTLSRRLEKFEPIEDGHVRMYTCGPTVYDYAHIGNFRAYMFEDILRRTLKFNGYKVTQVMNLTDVDDKTIRGAEAAGLSLASYTKKYKDAFFEDLKELGIAAAEHYPAATDHIPGMIDIIQKLMERGYAYQSDDGSIYFSIAKFADYGKLARIDRSGIKPGARVASDEYEKESISDFALWKAWDEADGDVAWDSPWGKGRPGWHIECSAMSMTYLGPTFDLHTGGIDNMFPHHENEIAQSEAANGGKFVQYWMHCGYLMVEGKKMSKSLGNFYTLRDILDKGYSARDVRYVLLSAHYRQQLNFTFDAVDAAHTALARMDGFCARLKEAAGAGAEESVPGWALEGRAAFVDAVNDDLNMPEALASVFEIVHAGNKAMDSGELASPMAVAALRILAEIDQVLGVMSGNDVEGPGDEIMELVKNRQEARKARDFTQSDEIRDELLAKGWVVKDTPGGSKVSRK